MGKVGAQVNQYLVFRALAVQWYSLFACSRSSTLAASSGLTPTSQLPFSGPSPTETFVNNAVRHFLRLFAFAWLALGLGVPASAWTIHDAAHVAAKVSVDAHHHHNDDGSVSAHEHEDGENPDGGHDHMPSILLSAVTIPQAGMTLAGPDLVRQTYAIAPSRGVALHASDGLRRPPRLG